MLTKPLMKPTLAELYTFPIQPQAPEAVKAGGGGITAAVVDAGVVVAVGEAGDAGEAGEAGAPGAPGTAWASLFNIFRRNFRGSMYN